MSTTRDNGAVIGVDNSPSTSDADGIWSLEEQQEEQGASNWPSLASEVTVEYLVIAGGGGASDDGTFGGGGGAGGYRCSVSGESSGGGASAETTLTCFTGTTYTVTVGAGGSGDQSGNPSSIEGSDITTVSSTGGGRGRYTTGASGGSGGGAGSGQSGGSGAANQGYDGGATNGYISAGSGGGGAGAAGAAMTASGQAGEEVLRSLRGRGDPGLLSHNLLDLQEQFLGDNRLNRVLYQDVLFFGPGPRGLAVTLALVVHQRTVIDGVGQNPPYSVVLPSLALPGRGLQIKRSGGTPKRLVLQEDLINLPNDFRLFWIDDQRLWLGNPGSGIGFGLAFTNIITNVHTSHCC